MLLSLLIGPPSNEEFLVEISGTTVTITCPLSEESNIAWEITGTKPSSRDRKYVIENHDSSPANVSCASGGKKHEMYLNVRGEWKGTQSSGRTWSLRISVTDTGSRDLHFRAAALGEHNSAEALPTLCGQ